MDVDVAIAYGDCNIEMRGYLLCEVVTGEWAMPFREWEWLCGETCETGAISIGSATKPRNTKNNGRMTIEINATIINRRGYRTFLLCGGLIMPMVWSAQRLGYNWRTDKKPGKAQEPAADAREQRKPPAKMSELCRSESKNPINFGGIESDGRLHDSIECR